MGSAIQPGRGGCSAPATCSAEGGVLWFEKADTLLQLKEQPVEAIRSAL